MARALRTSPLYRDQAEPKADRVCPHRSLNDGVGARSSRVKPRVLHVAYSRRRESAGRSLRSHRARLIAPCSKSVRAVSTRLLSTPRKVRRQDFVRTPTRSKPLRRGGTNEAAEGRKTGSGNESLVGRQPLDQCLDDRTRVVRVAQAKWPASTHSAYR